MRGSPAHIGTYGGFPFPKLQRDCLGEPDVAIDSGSLVKPAIAEAGVDANDDVILRTVGEEVA